MAKNPALTRSVLEQITIICPDTTTVVIIALYVQCSRLMSGYPFHVPVRRLWPVSGQFPGNF